MTSLTVSHGERPAMRGVVSFLVAAAAGAALLNVIGDGGIPLGPYALAVAGAAAWAAVRRSLCHLPSLEPNPPAMFRLTGAPVPPAAGPAPLIRWRGLLARAAISTHAAETRLIPRLRALTASHLAGLGIDLDRQPDRARRHLGPDAFDLVTSDPNGPVEIERVRRLVDRLAPGSPPTAERPAPPTAERSDP